MKKQAPDLFTAQYKEFYDMAVAMPLEDKIEEAIELLRAWEWKALQSSPFGYYLAFSGGKDSIVIDKLAQMAGVKYTPFYNNVTIDPPELVRFLKRQYPHVPWNNYGCSLPLSMKDESQGPPTRVSRWCCEKYKEQGGNGRSKIIGVRGEESANRKTLWRPITKSNKWNDLIFCPIAYWTDANVWTFIRANEMPYCELYDQGYTRLGCIGCPQTGPKGQTRDFARWPRYETLWKKGFQIYWDTWKGVPRLDGNPRWIEKLPNVEALWQWWRSGEAYDPENDCQTYQW